MKRIPTFPEETKKGSFYDINRRKMMNIKDLVINAIAKKAEEINHKPGIYVRIFAKKIETIRLTANKEKNVEGLMKIKKDLKLNDLFYILAMILGNGYVKNVDLGEVDFF